MIGQTKTKQQETLEFKMNKQMQTFSISPPKKLVEGGKCLLAVTSFGATNSVFNIISENNSFSISTPGHWSPEDGEELINELYVLLELSSENGIELLVKGSEKRGTRIEIENSGSYISAGFDHFRSEILSELKRRKYRDIEGMIYRLQLTYDEIVDMLDIKNIKYTAGFTIGYTIPPKIYEITDIPSMIKSLLPNNVKVNVSIDDIKLNQI